MKNKTVLTIVAIIIIFLGICITFWLINKYSNKPKEEKNTTYEVAFKVNPLVKFKFTYENDEAIINNAELTNDKAKEIFAEVDFISMKLNDAIILYGDKLSESEIVFNTINIFTNWDNKDYFKAEKYNINVEVVDTKYLQDIFNNTKNELVLNKKYYSLNDKSNYKYIIFKENGKMAYKVSGYEEMETDSDIYPHHYTLNENGLALKGNEERGYFGWIFSHEECTILYNMIACDYYLDTNYDLKEEFIKTEYYEIRQ